MTATAQFTGNCTAAPELRALQNGSMVAEIRFAVKQRGKKNRDGSWEDLPPWYMSAEVWGKGGQWAADNLNKGDFVQVSGVLEQQAWTDKQTGETKTKLIITQTTVDLLQSKADREVIKAAKYGGAPAQQPQSVAAGVGAQNLANALGGNVVPNNGNDIPF